MLSQILKPLNSIFLSPELFLAGLTSLFILGIIYMIGNRPEKEIMPSMMFFMKKEKQGAASKAIRKIRTNLFLILHIIALLSLAAAAAQPYIQTESRTGKSVVLIDSSASMQSSISQAKDYAIQNLGQQNTVIEFNEDSNVLVENAKPSEARAAIERISTEGVKTNIRQALQTATEYQGNIVIASDMDTTTGPEASGRIESLEASGRKIAIANISSENSHGITSIEIEGDGSALVNITNFKNRKRELTVDIGKNQKTLKIEGLSTRTQTVQQKGKTQISLPEDEMKFDNTGYVVIPQNRSLEFLHIKNSKDPYLRKSVDLIENVEYKRVEAPLENIPDSDIYYVESPRTISQNIQDIEKKVKNDGKTLYVKTSESFRSSKYDSVDAERPAQVKSDISITSPSKTYLGSSESLNSSFSGEQLANPDSKLVRKDYGKGSIYILNFWNTSFNKKITYPIFWKRTIFNSADIKSPEELNIRTGSRTEKGKLIENPGFVRSNPTLAANLNSFDESFDEANKQKESSISKTETNKPLQNYGLAIAVLIIAVDMALLKASGEL